MSQSYTGEIRMFGGAFSPSKWSFCDGQLLGISSNAALFSLLGTAYNGDGRVTFGLPDMRGRVPMHYGQGVGLTNRPIGSRLGEVNVTLTTNQIPPHRHTFNVVNQAPSDRVPEMVAAGYAFADKSAAFHGDMNADMIQNAGSNYPHGNMMPYLVINFILCMEGLYPSRS